MYDCFGLEMKHVLLHDSWERVLPRVKDCTFDLIYTDPPYGKAYKSNIPGDSRWNKTGKTTAKFDREIENDRPMEVNWCDLAKQLYRVLKEDRFLFLHCDIPVIMEQGELFKRAGFAYKGCAIWTKHFAIGGDLHGAMKRDWEPMLYFAKGRPKFNPVPVMRKGSKQLRNRISETEDWFFEFEGQKLGFDVLLPKKEKIGFPTQKPLDLCKQVISLCTSPGDIVLDPFAGSGSIPLAAKELGRKFFAVEVDKSAAKICSKRIGENFSTSVRI